MAATEQELLAFVNADEGDSVLLGDCLAEADALVAKYVGSATVPDVILKRATLEVAADLFNRRNAPNGILNQQFSGPDGVGTTPIRIARDPLTPAYPVLQRWILPW